MRIVTYQCERCRHEWSVDQSPLASKPAGAHVPAPRAKCPACAHGFGELFMATVHPRTREIVYACRKCDHEWSDLLRVSGHGRRPATHAKPPAATRNVRRV